MNTKLETKILYNIFKEDIDRIIEFEYSRLSLAELQHSGVMDGVNPQELLIDIIGKWYNLKAEYYTQNSEDIYSMIEAINIIEKNREVDQE